MIWRSLNNSFEDTLYSQEYVNPQFNPSGVNSWTTYILKRPVYLSAGEVYIGWKQNIFYKLNVGYDRNNDQRDKMFFKTFGNWEAWTDYMPLSGCMMIRPVLGKPVKEEDFISVAQPLNHEEKAYVYPNPSEGIIRVYWPEEAYKGLWISVTDLRGILIWKGHTATNSYLNLSFLQSGFYLIHILNEETGKSHILRFIKM